MQTRLKARLFYWKTKSQSKTKRYKNLLACNERQASRIVKLENRLAELERRLAPQSIANHHYPGQLIALAVFMVVVGNSSLRCAAKTVGFVSGLFGWTFQAPSHNTIRNWVMRCGLYGYEKGSVKSGTYVGIIDESISMGQEKLLLLLGVKQYSTHSQYAALQQEDVEVLGMQVQQSWKGEEVAAFIKQRLKHHGGIELSYMISDRGTALLAALRKLNIDFVSDCTHALMNIVKQVLGKEEQLGQLASQIGQLRQKLRLTKYSYLLPPTLRDKDRFLRLFTMVDWAVRMQSYWNRLDQQAQQKLSFLKSAQAFLDMLAQIRTVVVQTAQVLKTAGLSPYSYSKWEQLMQNLAKKQQLFPQTQTVIERIDDYFKQQQDMIHKHQRLLCCSDVIESIFGRYKNKGGMKLISADVLKIALFNKTIDTEFVQLALTHTSQQQVLTWQRKFVCHNRLTIMRRMKNELKNVP